MSSNLVISNGAGSGDAAQPVVSQAAIPSSDPPAATVVIAAVDLLSHFWTRPVATEMEIWSEAGEIEAETHRLIASDPASEPLRVPSSLEESLELLDEYERLFVGPGQVPCPPYESFWREDVSVDIRRTLMGPCTAELKELYCELGLQVSSLSGELPDHVAVELEAIAYAVLFEETGAVAKRLFDEHLCLFLPRLCRAVSHDALSPFYRGLAALTLDWLAGLRTYFGVTDSS
jgi:TorA maturation chaperone TorD